MSILRQSVLSFVAVLATSVSQAETVTFEGLLASPETFYKGETESVNNDPWYADGFEFSNSTSFPPYWSGWAYSNTTDTTTAGFGNEHSAITGGGSNGAGGSKGAEAGETYAVAYNSGATINLPSGAVVQSVDWTNGTYPFLSMQNGDGFAKPFGGLSGNDSDYFRAILTGYSDVDRGGSQTGAVTLTLADFTFGDNSMDYIVDTWQVNEDLTTLGDARSIGLSFESSDVGTFGINTPTYLVIDNLQYVTAIPEPGFAGLMILLGGVVACRRNRRR